MTTMSKLSKELQYQLASEYESRADGMTCKTFCDKKGISYPSFKNFLYNSKRKSKKPIRAVQSFVPVVIDEPTTRKEEVGIKIICKKGATLIISNNFNESLLLKLINLLN